MGLGMVVTGVVTGRQNEALHAPAEAAGSGAGIGGCGGIGEVVGFHLLLAQGAVNRHLGESLAELELTQKQVMALWLVGEHPGTAQTGLGQHMRMDRASTMAIVNRLQGRGLVERGKSASDGRKQALHLTAAGRAMLDKARQALASHEAWLKARYTDREVAVLIELLARLHG